MRLFSPPSRRPHACDLGSLVLLLIATSLSLAHRASAFSYKAVPQPDLDLKKLGTIALAGNFDSISLYEYVGQDEDGLSRNGSQSLLGRFPNGAFTDLESSDSYIESMCPFVARDGTLNGIVVGGNFTSLGGQKAQAVGLYNPTDGSVTPLPGIIGHISSVYCDNEREEVYVGGSFSAGKSTNAMAWTTGWTNLPFAGFNGPISAINKLPNGNIIFGGSFSAIGDMSAPSSEGRQVINLAGATLSTGGTSADSRFNDAESIICTTPTKLPSKNNWLLKDGTPGYLKADFPFPFVPSKLRLYNTQIEGYATKTWRFTYLPTGGILNFTFHHEDGPKWCTNECPLSEDAARVGYQDYYFVNPIEMFSFRVDISDWYGKAGGLSGIELFQDDIYSYAINDFNEPHCDGISTKSLSKTIGPWKSHRPAGESLTQYLTSTLQDGATADTDLSVVFTPNIKQSGQYAITIWTPGCIPDGSCGSRGVVNIEGTLASSTSTTPTGFSTEISQTNDYIKYDQVFTGYIEATSDSFSPTVTLTPLKGQKGPLTTVAQRVRFDLIKAVEGVEELNGLFEYNPNQLHVDTDFSKSAIDTAAMQLQPQAQFLSIAVDSDVTYVAGAFSSDSVQNVMAIDGGEVTPMANVGLNDVVQTIYVAGGVLYAAGNFTSTADNSVTGLANVAMYSTSKAQWLPMGAGVNGAVYAIVPLTVTVNGKETDAIAVSGHFNSINKFGDYSAIPVLNIAVWVPSENNWLQNVDSHSMALTGQLNAYTTVPGSDPLWSGGVDSQMLAASGIVGLTTGQQLALQPYPVQFTAAPQTSSKRKSKRVVSQGTVDGVVTGLFYGSNGMKFTVLGGHFSAVASDGSTVSNLIFIDDADSGSVTGLPSNSDPNSAILAIDYQGTSLFAGGSIDGGVLIYDLAAEDLADTQPPPLVGGSAVVNAIATRPSSSEVYVGGSFKSAGSLGCPALCVYDTHLKQWNPVAAGLSASSTINFLEWASDNRLIIAGDLEVEGTRTGMATYDAKAETFSVNGGAPSLPGPITTYTALDGSFSSAFVAGTARSGSSYLYQYDGDRTWTKVRGLGPRTVIYGLQTFSFRDSRSTSGIGGSDQVLLVSGQLDLDRFGLVSAALWDGKSFKPLALSTMNDGRPGTVSKVFVQNTDNLLVKKESYLALGFIVLIGLACALGCTFLLVVLGIAFERIQRRRQGYVPAPSSPTMFEKSGGGNVGKIPPEKIFGSVKGGGNSGSRL